jgi:hypothetical protein
MVVSWLKSSGFDELQARLEQLGADAPAPARRRCSNIAKREQQVHRADVLVVGGEQPAAPAVRMVVRVVVDDRVRWRLRGGPRTGARSDDSLAILRR